jgi:hypothetical protein
MSSMNRTFEHNKLDNPCFTAQAKQAKVTSKKVVGETVNSFLAQKTLLQHLLNGATALLQHRG